MSLSRRKFVAAGSAVLGGFPFLLRARERRPNIVLILADDMGFSDLGCYGSEIATPNIDGLGREGLRFTQFYNNARCCPSRASLLTGLYPHQTGIGHMTADYQRPGYRGELNRQCVTIAEALRPADYHTLMVGKWHVTTTRPGHSYDWPTRRGFDHFYGTISGAGSYYEPASLMLDETPLTPPSDFYYTDSLGDHAAAFIGEYAQQPKPFFLYAAFTAPHWPLHAPAADVARHQDRYRGGWDQLRQERHARQIAQGLVRKTWPLTPRDEQVPEWRNAPNHDWESRRMEIYAAQVDRLDVNVGKILSALRRSGIEENTLVFFLSDNGGCAEVLQPGGLSFVPRTTHDGRPMHPGNDPAVMPGPIDTYQSYGIGWANASNTPFRLYKHWVHEGGIATPLLMRWPARIKRSGSTTHQVGHITDIMATCLDAAGAAYPEGGAAKIIPLEGRSLLPILDGRTRDQRDICWEHEGNRAIRHQKWKLVSRFPDRWELYDLDADRTEMHDLSATHPKMVENFTRQWSAWAGRVGVVPWKELEPIRKDG